MVAPPAPGGSAIVLMVQLGLYGLCPTGRGERSWRKHNHYPENPGQSGTRHVHSVSIVKRSYTDTVVAREARRCGQIMSPGRRREGTMKDWSSLCHMPSENC